MLIDDGKGRGNKAQVDDENRLRVRADVVPFATHVSEEESSYFSWNFVTADLATTETVIMVCNDSTDKNLLIDWIYLYSDVPASFDVHTPAYATWAGTAITGVNWNIASGKAAEATAIGDETGQATQGNILFTLQTNEVATDQFSISMPIDGKIVLGYHDAIAIDVVGNPAVTECTVAGYYH